MKTVFRVDSSSDIGTGHVVRCLSLATSLKEAGAEVIFVCRELPGNLIDEIVARGFRVRRLQKNNGNVEDLRDRDLAHADWLGVPWQCDALQTEDVLKDIGSIDWLIVDHYALDDRWESVVRPLVKKLMVIDDIFDRPHVADLLLNQNILPGSNQSYRGLLPASCRFLCGPRFALLQNQYEEMHYRVPPRSGEIQRLLIYFGGVDEANLTVRALEALIILGCSRLVIDVVLPVAGPHRESIRSVAGRLPGARVHEFLPSLAQLMIRADLAIGAAGASSWERLCLGLPSLVVTLSDNQQRIAEGLHANGLAKWLGHADAVSVESLVENLRPLLAVGLAEGSSEKCHAAVDGKGVKRVMAFMQLDPGSHLSARPAEIKDEALVSDWLMPSLDLDDSSYGRMLQKLDNDLLYLVESAPGVIVASVGLTFINAAWQLQTIVSPAAGSVCPVSKIEQVALRKLRKDIKGALCLVPKLGVTQSALRISVCSDAESWINDFLPALIQDWLNIGHVVTWAHDAAQLPPSKICFYLSYGRIVNDSLRSKHDHNLVVHESDLPKGRGWSPLTWQVLAGAQKITVTLFEAIDEVDAGQIYAQRVIELQGDELVDELRRLQIKATFSLCSKFIDEYPRPLYEGRAQIGVPSYFPRRLPVDSLLDTSLSLGEQFNLLRVCDNVRYPAWFEYAGARYKLEITRLEQHND